MFRKTSASGTGEVIILCMTVDLADFDHSTLNIVNGESGNFLSSNYMDQWKAWYEGYTFPFPFSKQAVEKARVHDLTLKP